MGNKYPYLITIILIVCLDAHAMFARVSRPVGSTFKRSYSAHVPNNSNFRRYCGFNWKDHFFKISKQTIDDHPDSIFAQIHRGKKKSVPIFEKGELYHEIKELDPGTFALILKSMQRESTLEISPEKYEIEENNIRIKRLSRELHATSLQGDSGDMEVKQSLERLQLPGLDRPVDRFQFYQNRLAVVFQDSSKPSFFDLVPSQTWSKTSAGSAFFVQHVQASFPDPSNEVIIWEISSGKKLMTISIKGNLQKYAINNAGNTLAIYYWSGLIEFYNIHDHSKTVPFHLSQLKENKFTWGQVLAFSPDDEFLIFNDRCLPRGYSQWVGGTSVLDGKTGELLWEMKEYFNNGIQLSRDKQKILLHHDKSKKNIIEVKLRTGKKIKTFDIGFNPRHAEPSDSEDLDSISIEDNIEDLQSYDIGVNHRPEASRHGRPDKLLYGVDDSVLVFYYKYNTLYTFRTSPPSVQYELFWHPQPRPIENVYVSSSKEYTVLERPNISSIIDIKNNSNLFNFEGDFNLFSPNGTLIFTGKKIFDLKSREEIHHFENIEIGIFSDDSQFFAKIGTNDLLSIYRVNYSNLGL